MRRVDTAFVSPPDEDGLNRIISKTNFNNVAITNVIKAIVAKLILLNTDIIECETRLSYCLILFEYKKFVFIHIIK